MGGALDVKETIEQWAANDWLKQTVARGLAGCIALRLEGAPPEDVIVKSATLWHSIIKNWPVAWDREQDQERLLVAFRNLMGQVKRWPSPAELKPLLPPRKPQKALAKPDYPPEKAKANLAKIKQFLKTVGRT